jgi:hypothetical protein
MVSGRIVRTTRTWRVIVPRLDSTVAQSPSGERAFFELTSGELQRMGLGTDQTSGAIRRVCVPERNWLITRPVVSISGYSASTSSAGGLYFATLKRALPSAK